MSDRDDAAEEAAHHQDMLNRERESEEALEEAKAKGVSREKLIVLARETGCYRWAMQQSLNG